jgi:hypothetical protein
MNSAPEELERVRNLVTHEVSVSTDPAAINGWLHRMCRAAARDLPASGVGLSLVNDTGTLMTAASSGTESAVIEELQFMLGEGPCLDAYESRQPVLVPDLEVTHTNWPGYAPAAREHGVRGVFAFPLQVGRARLGALDVYRAEAGELSPRAMTRALAFADLAMESFLDAQPRDALVSEEPERSTGLRYEIYQAQGMLMVQLGITLEDALARLRAYAFASGRSLAEVADDVLNRRLFVEGDDS